MDQNHTALALLVAALIVFTLLFIIFITHVKHVRIQRERDEAVSELEAIKSKYRPGAGY
tara:strand:+ start:208 stop:384 length:177 start_codon:yes stop_codon:yes gene_type:complete